MRYLLRSGSARLTVPTLIRRENCFDRSG